MVSRLNKNPPPGRARALRRQPRRGPRRFLRVRFLEPSHWPVRFLSVDVQQQAPRTVDLGSTWGLSFVGIRRWFQVPVTDSNGIQRILRWVCGGGFLRSQSL